MIGLHKKESDKFEAFFEIVQRAAIELDCVFFLDAGDGRDFETDTLEGEDLMGWLIPNKMLSVFEAEWETGDVSDEWSDFYKWAIWTNPDKPKIMFE